MRMRSRNWVLGALGLLLAAPAARAQGTSAFHWYVGGQGGIFNFRTPTQTRTTIPTAGGHLLVTAHRVGLLLSVEQAFGSDETTATIIETRDAGGTTVQSAGTYGWTFQGMRRYTAGLLAYPLQNRNIQPYVGLGFGILHATGTSPSNVLDDGDRIASGLSTSGFLAGIAGLEFRLGPFGAFGQYQVQTKQGRKMVQTPVATSTGSGLEVDVGEWTTGAIHSVSAGLRINLGRAREGVYASSD